MSISVLILTFNEEANIAECLASVAWSDDVLVVDSFSTDRTVEIARAGGARVIQRAFDNFASQRNFGLVEGGLRHPWVLHLDADERVTPAGHRELLDVMASAARAAFEVPSKMMLYGRWLRHAAMYPTYQVRFGRRDALQFRQVGHGQREALDRDQIGTLREPLLHHSFSKGFSDWVARHNRYSSDEAVYTVDSLSGRRLDWSGLVAMGDRVRRRRALKELSFRLPFRPLFRFVYVYVLRRGFLDGSAGLTYALLMAWYEYLIVLKADELRRRRAGGRV